MRQEFRYKSSDKKSSVHAVEWIPKGEPKAVLQIAHGMCEYVMRYDGFADWLSEQGIYVVGNDHLGHGETAAGEEDLGYFADKHGNRYVLQDIHRLRKLTGKKYPDKPYFILGHSMGSFLIRQYISYYGEDLSGAIIMGTGWQPVVSLYAGRALCNIIALFKNWRYRSKLLDIMAFGSYLKRIEKPITMQDWISRDEAVVYQYKHDPFCNYHFTLNGYNNMFRSIRKAEKKSNIARVPLDLPIFLVSGSEDPVGAYGKGVTRTYEAYQKAGIKDVSMKFYEEDRHEVLNELDRDRVYEDIKDWIFSKM